MSEFLRQFTDEFAAFLDEHLCTGRHQPVVTGGGGWVGPPT
ncbi:MAG: hypothetical protein JWP80_1888 [Pseudomonas sp.]|nr:hypothetical protein [Pseudomonas sp.]